MRGTSTNSDHRLHQVTFITRMKTPKKLQPKSIANIFSAVPSFKQSCECDETGCKAKAAFGFHPPAKKCDIHKLENMHLITLGEIGQFKVAEEEIVECKVPEGQLAPMEASFEDFQSNEDSQANPMEGVIESAEGGMHLNPHWAENNGTCPNPSTWRTYSALQKSHSKEMKVYSFDLPRGGEVKCKVCNLYPYLAEDIRMKVVRSFLSKKRRREKKTKLSALRLNAGVPVKVSGTKKRKRLRKQEDISEMAK